MKPLLLETVRGFFVEASQGPRRLAGCATVVEKWRSDPGTFKKTYLRGPPIDGVFVW